MFSFLTNEKNDLYLTVPVAEGKASKGSMLVRDSGAEALRQEIVNRVRLQRGEYDYNLMRGIDYTGLLLTDTPLVRIWEEQVLSLVREIDGVNSIVSWNYGLDENNFLFQLTVDTIYGTIEIKG